MSEEKGKIIIIKRNGQDRVTYPLVSTSCLFGSGMDCDIRVQLPSVSDHHCVFRVGVKDKVHLSSLSPGNITLLNGAPVSGRPVPVNHKDILTVVDRCFRFEYPPGSPHYVQDELASVPEVKSLKIVSPRVKPPLSNVFQVNGTPGKIPPAKKKATRKSLESAEIFPDEVSPLSHPKKTYSRKKSPSPRSLVLSSSRAKRVSFGPALSPEQFDKNMPPATPVRRGSLPRRQTTPPNYFGSPIITQYPRPKKNRLSVIPKEKSIAEENAEEAKQSPTNRHGKTVSRKSQSPSTINKSSPKVKGSPVQVLQHEQNDKSPVVPRKSPLAKKLPKSVSPKRSPASPSRRTKTKSDNEPELVMPLPDSLEPLSNSPKQTVANTQQNSPSQRSTSKEIGSSSKLSPLKVWASVVSPNTKQASPLSRRKSSVHSTENSTSDVSTPKQSLKKEMNDKKILSSGKRSSGTHALKRLSTGKSPARPVSLATPARRSPTKVQKKTSSASKLRSSLPVTQHFSVGESLEGDKIINEVPVCEVQHTTDDASNIVFSGSAENYSLDVATPKSASKRQVGHKKLSSKEMFTSPRVLKRLSPSKSPALSFSLTSPARRTSGKAVEKLKSSGKLRSSLPSVSKSVQKSPKSETSVIGDQLDSISSEDDQPSVLNQTPINRRRSKLPMTPKSAAKQLKSPLVQNIPVDTILASESEKNYFHENLDTKNLTSPSALRLSRSSLTPKSDKKEVGSLVKKSPLASSPKTLGPKRKSDFALVSEPAKKMRLSASFNSPLSTPSSRASPRSQSTPVSVKSPKTPKELAPKAVSPTPVKSGHAALVANVSPKLSAGTPSKSKFSGSISKVSPNVKPVSASKSKDKTLVKTSPKVRSPLLLPSKENTKTPSNRTLSGSKSVQSSSKAKLGISAKASPKMKSLSTPAKFKLSTPAKKITPTAKSSAKKTLVSKSVKKLVSHSKLVHSTAKSVKKALSIKKSSKKALWTDVVRRGIMKKKATAKPKVVRSLLSNAIKRNKTLAASNRSLPKESVSAPHKMVIALTSTGHANSPATIIIQKRSSNLKEPAKSRTPLPNDMQPQTPDHLYSLVVTKTPSTSSKVKRESSFVKTRSSLPLSATKRKSILGSQKSSPDVSSILTPNISQERFVSPLTTPRVSRQNNSFLEKYVLGNQHLVTPKSAKAVYAKSGSKSEGLVEDKRLLKAETPKADYRNVAGLKRLVQSPKDSPKADYRDARGIKRLLQTEKDSPKADYRDVRGIKRLLQTPRDSPTADYSNVVGVRNLLKTPASAKRSGSKAKTNSTKKSSPQADYTKVKGVKQLFKAAGSGKSKVSLRKATDKEVVREPDFTNVEGVKQLFREPEENEFNISGLQQLFSPMPNMSFGVKDDSEISPAIQETPSTQEVSSPKSRRKRSFNSPTSVTNLNDSNKKPVRMTSPGPQRNAVDSEHGAGKEDLVESPAKSSLRESLRSPVTHLVTLTPESANKASRSTRSASATASPKPQDVLQSPSRRKSGGTVLPAGTPLSSRNGKSQKSSMPAKDMVSPIHSVIKVGSPSVPSPKVRRQTPTQPAKESVSHIRKSSPSPKGKRKSVEKAQSLDLKTNEVTSPKVLKTIENSAAVSTPQQVRAIKKVDNVMDPVQVALSDDDGSQLAKNGVEIKQQRNKEGRFVTTKTTPKAYTKKGGKKSANQEMYEPGTGETQPPVLKEGISTNLPDQQVSSAGKESFKNSGRAARSKKDSAEEALDKYRAVKTGILPKSGKDSTNKKASIEETTEGYEDASTEIPQKGGRSTRSKKGTTQEIGDNQPLSTDLSQKGSRITRGKKKLALDPVENSVLAPGASSPKIGKRSKAKNILNKETEDSQSLDDSDVKILEVFEVKSSKRTRGREEPVETPVKKASLPSRQTRSRSNPSADVESSGSSQNILPSQDSVETPSKGRRGNKRKQENLASDVNYTLISIDQEKDMPETLHSVKQLKTRRNQNIPSSLGDGDDTQNKRAPEVATPPKVSKRSKNVLAKIDVTASPNAPSVSTGSRTRRNQKTSETDSSQDDKSVSSSQGLDGSSTATRQSKRGRKQESKIEPEVITKQSRTLQDQKNTSSSSGTEIVSANVDSTDKSGAVSRHRRGKIEASTVKVEVPDAKQSQKESNSLSQVDTNEITQTSRKKQIVGSPSQQILAVKKRQTKNVIEIPSKSEKPKRGGKVTSSVSNDVDTTEASNTRSSRSKRNAVDSIEVEISPKKRARKEANTSKRNLDTGKKGSKVTKMQAKSVKTHSPVLDTIPEVEEEVTPVVSRKITRAKTSTKQVTKETPIRRPTRSRRK